MGKALFDGQPVKRIGTKFFDKSGTAIEVEDESSDFAEMLARLPDGAEESDPVVEAPTGVGHTEPKPAFEDVSEAEIEAFAQKHGVDKEFLEEFTAIVTKSVLANLN